MYHKLVTKTLTVRFTCGYHGYQVLLNLTLCECTTDVVAKHDKLGEFIQSGNFDNDNLMLATTKTRLEEVRFKLRMNKNLVVAHQARAAAVTSKERHVMLSYCWDDQPTIIRLRKALAERGWVSCSST